MASPPEEKILCSICMEQCKQPQKLCCEHVFCTTCLSEYRRKVSDSGKQTTFPCPVCRTEIDWSGEEFTIESGATGGIPARKVLRIAPSTKSQSCDICNVNKKSKLAVVRCRVCSESMCIECETCHKAMKATRNHPIVDLGSCPKEGSYDIRHCPVHSEELFESFCEVHQTLCCKICVEDHTQCETVTKLKVASENEEVVNGLQSLIGDLSLYEADIEQLTTDRKQSLQSLERERTLLREEIEHFKKKVLAKLTLELSRNLPLVETPLKKDVNQLVEDIDWCSSIMREIGNVVEFLKDIFQNGSREDIFVSYHLMKGEIDEICQSIINRHEEMKTTNIKFELNDICQRFMNFSEPLLTNSLTRHKAEFSLSTHLKPIADRTIEPSSEINTIVSGETNDCDITSVIFLPHNRVLVFDKGKKFLKIFNESGIAESKLDTSGIGQPQLLIKVNDSTCVLTASSGSMYTYHINGSITYQCTLSTPGYHQGTVLCNDNYIATCLDSLKVMNKQGTVKQTIKTDNEGAILFESCRFITCSKSKGRVYVSDTGRNTVSAFDFAERGLNSTPSFVYQHKELKHPTGIVVSRQGYVFVCGRDSNNVHLINNEGNLVQIFPMSMPYAIALAEETMKLAISSFDDFKRNRVHIYRLV